MGKGQAFSFGLGDKLRAEVAGVTLNALHDDADAICRSYERLAPLAERLGVETGAPRLAGFAYNHVSTLGAEVVFAENSEPNVLPIIKTPADIDRLTEPPDYLRCGVVPERLATFEELKKRRADALHFIGHLFEGPVTSAELLMGQDFFTLPYDDPERAHRLLSFCVESACNYARIISERLGNSIAPGPAGIPDDFAGMFPPDMFAEFIVPYWDRMYQNLEATERHLHSELLRKDHLGFLKELNIAVFDPSADQYVTTELLSRHCPVPFTARILSWDIRDHTASELQSMYRELAKFSPAVITFYMTALEEEEKVRALLDVARELAAQQPGCSED